jgi:DNA polymerase III epsilon subunit-like protein
MRIVVLDTETSGLPDDPNARVVEIAAALFDTADTTPLATFTSLICPDVLTDEGRAVIEKVSHIPFEELDAAPTPAEVWAAFQQFLGTAAPFKHITAYNREFDQHMIEHTLPEEAKDLPWGPCVMVTFAERFAVYSHMKEDLTGPIPFRLSVAARLLDLQHEGDAHRALADAVLAGQISVRLAQGVMPPEMVIVDKIRAIVAERLRVFHAQPVSVLPKFCATTRSDADKTLLPKFSPRLRR